MKGKYDYPEDTFTENDVLLALEGAGLRYKQGSRYILTQCPLHPDKNPSAQIYKDDWFVKCHAGCEGGRFHITKAFPDLRKEKYHNPSPTIPRNRPSLSERKKMSEHKYLDVDLVHWSQNLAQIPRDHNFKNIPLEILDDLGWKYDAENKRYFIPYYDRSRQYIPFAQWRNLGDGPRFNFWKDAKPIAYGLWNLDNPKLFLVEGTSDAAVLQYAAVPWIGVPSAGSIEIVKSMSTYCHKNGIQLVYAGDNDSAGEKLREVLDESAPYRVKQPPKKYKDWGDFFEAEGVEAVQDYCNEELFARKIRAVEVPEIDGERLVKASLGNIQKVFPEAQEMELDGPAPARVKEQTGSAQPLY